jgi:tetratricopeptide (TPR) repeat protein/2-polyprenyl-3-methyl-5-hydroxy-6-metoxy-1,4-benzoquinol methylase
MNRKERRAGVSGAGGERRSALAEMFGAALAQHQRGALAEAERRYRYLLTLYPKHADSLHNLGLIVLNGGNATAAVDLFERAIAINDRTAEYHYNIALAWRALNRADKVAVHLERAIALRNDYPLAHLNLGNVRHEQGRLADAAAAYERALALSPNLVAARFNLGNVLAEQRRWDAAIACYNQVLAAEPNHAEAHGGLGSALTDLGRPRDAIAHLERAIALRPDLIGAYESLGRAYLSAGQLHQALLAIARALELKETTPGKSFFAQCAMFAEFTKDPTGRFRQLVLRALNEGWAGPRELSNACMSLIKLNDEVKGCIARVNSAWPRRLHQSDAFGSSGMAALAKDELLHRLLECNPVGDLELERLLTTVRATLLKAAIESAAESANDQTPDPDLLAFYCAVARQCFVNEYVFSTTESEIDQVQRLCASLEAALAAGNRFPPLWLAAVGAYFPLHTLPNASALLDRSWPDAVESLLVQQVKEPAEERRIRTTIPVLTNIDNEVSRIVREMYEQSPYPRWIKAGPPTLPVILEGRPSPVADVLIAGCGTGVFTLEFARAAPNARFLAIDLSLSSISYAKRMAQSLGMTNIEFAQADLLKSASIGQTFDFIDTSGVLHHLGDPWAGWRALLPLLRPDGMMQIGLYSELARKNVVAARALIAERGFRPTPADIRQLREIVATSEEGSLLRSITRWSDYFTTSECRDLLFHPQEHRITLPEIKSFLAENGLQFAGFALDALTFNGFAARFPEQAAMSGLDRWRTLTDLDRWHTFETERPDTFAGMYRFWVHKPA